jgi:predicted exporter
MAVLVVTAGLALSGQRLILMHLVGMLLVAAVGSNYALFFDRRVAGTSGDPADPGTLVSLALANLTTVTGFGLLATSDLPVLRSIGTTVSIGVVLALAFSAVLAASSGRSWTALPRGGGPPTGPGAGA